MSLPRKALAELVSILAGVECLWPEKRNPSVGGTAWIELTLLSDVAARDGEYRRAVNPKNPLAFKATVIVDKLLTISLRAKSFDAAVQATDLLAEVRAQLSGVTAAAVYDAENIAFVRTHPITGVRSVELGARTRLEATMDVVWSARDGGTAGDDPGLTLGSAGPILVTGSS